MAECPLYYEHVTTMRSKEIGPRTPGVIRSVVPCCDHKHSPAPRHIAPKVIGGASLLKCGGELARCQIPEDKRGDA